MNPETELIKRWGLCVVCGAPRDIRREEFDGDESEMLLVCTADSEHEQR